MTSFLEKAEYAASTAEDNIRNDHTEEGPVKAQVYATLSLAYATMALTEPLRSFDAEEDPLIGGVR